MVELFHRIADSGSAQARRFVTEQGLLERVRFRNLAYSEVEADLRARGGTTAPALWNGTDLFEGAPAVLAALEALRTDPAA